MTANINLDRSKFGLGSISDRIIGYDIAEANAQTKEGDHSSAIFYLAPICNKARKVGKESKLPTNILKQYYPFPKKYYSFVVSNLPKKIKELPPEEIEAFILSFFSYIHRESKFDPNLENPKSGATGLCQLLPLTAANVAKEQKIKKYDLKNPYDNMKLGMNYFATLWLDNGGIVNKTRIMAYWNYGSGNTNHAMRHHKGQSLIAAMPQETRRFIKDVNYNSAMYRKLYGSKVHYLSFAVSTNRHPVHLAAKPEHKPKITVVNPEKVAIKVVQKPVIYVQVGAFHVQNNADQCAEAHPGAKIETGIDLQGKKLFRVKAPLSDREKAEKFALK
jgi:hypothetical protein